MVTLPVEPGFVREAPKVTAIVCMGSENVKGHFHGPLLDIQLLFNARNAISEKLFKRLSGTARRRTLFAPYRCFFGRLLSWSLYNRDQRRGSRRHRERFIGMWFSDCARLFWRLDLRRLF